MAEPSSEDRVSSCSTAVNIVLSLSRRLQMHVCPIGPQKKGLMQL